VTFGSEPVHFVGIGGAGMSAIAKVLIERGVPVSGSDLKRSRAATMLEVMGAEVHIGHSAAHAEGKGVVVVSAAIPKSNPELVAARRSGARVLTRGEALAEVLEGSRSIVVAGTHGKTSTTSMIVTVLRSADLDPTYLVGGGLNDVGTNARFGRSDIAVAESDESDGSFLLLNPYVAVVTNIEIDHVDYWKSFDELKAGFAGFLARVVPSGAVCVPAGDHALVAMARATNRAVETFGETGDIEARDVDLGPSGSEFTLARNGGEVPVSLRVPGLHNVANALAAAAACARAGVELDAIARGLSSYRGVERRYQLRGTAAGVTVIDDYAHHPSEIRATLAAARPGPWRRVVAVFQPHRYSRTAAMAGAFGTAFRDADRIVVTDVYGAGEAPVPGITGKLVADAVCAAVPGRPVAYLPHRADLVGYLVSSARAGDAVLTLGAGDVTTVGEELLARLEEVP
jgi:UDP-N-acetylmuramate--alanine ligase